MESPRFSQQLMLSTRSGAVAKGIRHIESKRVRLDSRRPAIRAAKLGKPTPGLASLKPWMEIARRWNLSEREKRGSFEVAITIHPCRRKETQNRFVKQQMVDNKSNKRAEDCRFDPTTD